MLVRSLAAMAAVWLMACASGGDAGDDSAGGPGLGDADITGDGVSPIDSSAVRGGDSGGGGTVDSGGTGADSSSGDDDGGMQGDDGGETQDSGGGGVSDTGGPVPDSGSTSTICDSSDPIYAIEAAAAVASGHFTLCLSGSGCAANQCCYEELSPGNICVAR